MSAPWDEGPYKVVLEFVRGGEGVGRRAIRLKHSPAVVPAQLQGRISPTTWQMFMQGVQHLADTHPYVAAPSYGRTCSWFGGLCVGAVVGICRFNPDGGDYTVWLPQVEQLLAQYRSDFEAGGAKLSLQRAQQSYWIQIDVNSTMALGQPAVPPGPHKLQM